MDKVSIKVSHVLRQGPQALLLSPQQRDVDDGGFVEMVIPTGDFIEHAGSGTERPIREAGARLLALLMGHPRIALLLQSALGVRRSVPIEFLVNRFAQSIPWEILWEQQHRFLGMHVDRPIFRSVQAPPPATLAPRDAGETFSIAVVLAAADLPADAHWDAIYRAVKSAKADYRVLAIV